MLPYYSHKLSKFNLNWYDKNDVFKHDLNKVWFGLKDTKTDSGSDCLDFKRFLKENITFIENASCYEAALLFLKNITRF